MEGVERGSIFGADALVVGNEGSVEVDADGFDGMKGRLAHNRGEEEDLARGGRG